MSASALSETPQALNRPTARPPESSGSDARVIALISFVHGISHFFHLLLPPLFPWLMPAFGLSYIEIGAAMSVFFVISGFGQAFAGFAVDRYGAFRVLLLGLSCFFAAGCTLAVAPHSAFIFVAAGLAGIGNAVFHPADFTILNRCVANARLGHAFSIHGLAGNLGWAAAPIMLTAIASLAGWRLAALAAASVALPGMWLIWRQRGLLLAAALPATTGGGRTSTGAFLRVPAVWLCFLFFLLVTTAFGALQNYATPVLQQLYGLPLGVAASALSSYLLAGAGGILLGGFVARHRADDKIIAVALSLAALLAAFLALGNLPAWTVLPLMAGIGFLTGMAGPSRDLLVRRAATARFGDAAYGRIYGFVYSGLDAGQAMAPLLFGGLMDAGRYTLVLVGVALLQGGAIFAALAAGRAPAGSE